MDIEKKCHWRGKTFIAHSFNARFCSKQRIDTAYKIYEGRNVFYSRDLIHKYFADLKAEYNRENYCLIRSSTLSAS